MINATSGVAASAYFTVPKQTQELSDDQKTGLEEVLSQYDTENLSDSDASEIVQSIKDLEIRPGAALGEALTEAGIDPNALSDPAGGARGPGGPGGAGGPGGGRGGPGGPGGAGGPNGAQGGGDGTTGVNTAAVEILESVLEALEEDEDSSEESFQELLNQQLEDAGIDSSQSIVDIRL